MIAPELFHQVLFQILVQAILHEVDVLGKGFTSSSRRTDQCLRLSRLDAETSAGESAQNRDLQAGAVMIDMICAHESQFFEWLPYNAGRLEKVPLPNDAAARRNMILEQTRARGAYRREKAAECLEKQLGPTTFKYTSSMLVAPNLSFRLVLVSCATILPSLMSAISSHSSSASSR